jgi:DNA polymerase-3 subunit gamma/tau
LSYLVLARKWRPKTFEELIGQEPIAGILKNAIINNKVAHAYIFSGPRGVGKTSSARILAKALNCVEGPAPQPCGACSSCIGIADGSSMDVSEIDGASNTGVDNIRELRERVKYAASGGKYKVYIIDEAHMLSTAAFNALLKTLEEPPPHVIFVLATTEPKKIPATVLSRCQHLPFRRIPAQKIKERLKFISAEEGIKISESASEMIARAADGSMRDSLTILDQITSFTDNITQTDIKDLLGITDIETLSQLASAVIEGNRKEIINIISELTNSGTDLKAFTKDFSQFIRDLLIAKIAGEGVIDLSEEESAAINKLKDKTSEEHIALILSESIKAEPGIRSALYPRIALEMTLIRLSLMSHFKSIDEALKMLQGIESKGSGVEAISSAPPLANEVDQKLESAEIADEASSTATQSILKSDIWNTALQKIEEINPSLSSKLREGNISISESEIKIVFNGGVSIHAESVKENIPVIYEAIKSVAGKVIPIKVETKKIKSMSKTDLKEKALKNPIVKEALELFEGRIVDVIPINDKRGGENV